MWISRISSLRRISVQAQKLITPLKELDPQVQAIIEREQSRQQKSIILTASENFTSKAVLQALGSVMTNKYSEGYPNARYYGGNQFIDEMEILCQQRALQAFRCDPKQWGVNVQALSGSPMNFYVYTAVLGPHGRMMALDLPHGGHLSHGFQSESRKVSATSIYFESLPYRLNEETGLVDYDTLQKTSQVYRPKLIVCGASAYARDWDYKRLREICDSIGAYLMTDMAHTAGIIAANVGLKDPFEYSDIVTTTTHKSLRGPRGALIFFRKGLRKTKKGEEEYDLENSINQAVFPGHQGGPHNHTISAIAVAMQLATTPEYKEYQTQVLKNSQALAKQLASYGYGLVSGGTDNHLVLLDLRSQSLDGARVDRVLENMSIACNKNTVPGDKSAVSPSGVRFGTPAMTSRGADEADFQQIAEFIHKGVQLTKKMKKQCNEKGLKKLKDFYNFVEENKEKELKEIRLKVEEFACKFPVIN